MQITLKVTPVDGAPFTVRTNLFTIVGLERKFKIRASELANGIAVEHLAYLAYECCKQQEITVSPVFDDFIKSVQGIEIVDTESANPIEAGHSDAL